MGSESVSGAVIPLKVLVFALSPKNSHGPKGAQVMGRQALLEPGSQQASWDQLAFRSPDSNPGNLDQGPLSLTVILAILGLSGGGGEAQKSVVSRYN